MKIESLSLRQREQTPGDCLCFGCFLHNTVFFVLSCALDIRLIPSKLVLKLAISSSNWVGRWNIKCLYKLNWRKWFRLRFNDASLEVSRDFPGKFEYWPFVEFCWQVAWVGVKKNQRLRWVEKIEWRLRCGLTGQLNWLENSNYGGRAEKVRNIVIHLRTQ